jgi:hypothetical protein
MAYTLSDHFRPLRLALRTNGVLVGLGLGSMLLFSSQRTLITWGLFAGEQLWPVRLAGAALVALGLCFVLIASQEVIGLSLLITVTVANLLFALVLLVSYFQQEFSRLTGVGQLLLVIVFVLCLMGALAPLPYLRAEYRY